MRKIKAKLIEIEPNWFQQHQFDAARVERLVIHLRKGGQIEPVVVVDYGGQYMPIDGHHRLAACEILGRRLRAWVVPSKRFEDLDARCRDERNLERAEDFIDCGGTRAMEVAPRRYA